MGVEPIRVEEGIASGTREARRLLSSAELLALHQGGDYQQIVPSPGDGHIIEVNEVVVSYKPPSAGAVAYEGNRNLRIRYGVTGGVSIATNGLLNRTVGIVRRIKPAAALATIPEGQPLIASLDGNITAGNGELLVIVRYHVVKV